MTGFTQIHTIQTKTNIRKKMVEQMRVSETEPIQFDYNRHAFTVDATVFKIDLSAPVWFLMGRRLVSARPDQPGLARLGPIHRSEG